MSVEFNEGDYSGFNSQQNSQTVGAIEKLVIKIGLAPDVRRARMVLVLIFVICLTITIFIFIFSSKGSGNSGVNGSTVNTSASRDAMIQSGQEALQKLNNH